MMLVDCLNSLAHTDSFRSLSHSRSGQAGAISCETRTTEIEGVELLPACGGIVTRWHIETYRNSAPPAISRIPRRGPI